MPERWLSARIHQLGTSPLAFRRRPRLAAALLLAAACAGCATFSPDGGMAVVNGIVAPELKSDVVKLSSKDLAGEADPRDARLLGSALSADGAVRIALLNNKGLQAAYNELGIAEAAWSRQACRRTRHSRSVVSGHRSSSTSSVASSPIFSL